MPPFSLDHCWKRFIIFTSLFKEPFWTLLILLCICKVCFSDSVLSGSRSSKFAFFSLKGIPGPTFFPYFLICAFWATKFPWGTVTPSSQRSWYVIFSLIIQLKILSNFHFYFFLTHELFSKASFYISGFPNYLFVIAT